MNSAQFTFSVGVGLGLTIIGGILAAKASVGFMLMLVGLGLMALATLTRRFHNDNRQQPMLVPIRLPAQGSKHSTSSSNRTST